MNHQKLKYQQSLKALLALEYSCVQEDFSREDNLVTTSALHPNARAYHTQAPFFRMVTLGGNAVMTADAAIHGWLRKFSADKPGHCLFELPNLLVLEGELNRHGYTLSETHHMFLPCGKAAPSGDFRVRWFFGDEIGQFYGDPRFPNAICDRFKPERPDIITVCAYHNEEIMGMAGCSRDAAGWQQIGIDVIPQYRGQGVGKHLVALLRNEIERRGEIPFYGTSLSNYRSWHIALACGFSPAWVEIDAKPIVLQNAVCEKIE
ncbi:MAG: GNAT family N-acetyltransferase [Oscillospiraceae bacterium]